MFHSNTDDETKNRILEDFSNTNGKITILVSTVAFGMGVNIRDVDIVIHWGLPRSCLSYWQEIGRCARDGRNGYAICYAYKRSYSKLDDEHFKATISLCTCIRTHVLQTFMLRGMPQTDLDILKIHSVCSTIKLVLIETGNCVLVVLIETGNSVF